MSTNLKRKRGGGCRRKGGGVQPIIYVFALRKSSFWFCADMRETTQGVLQKTKGVYKTKCHYTGPRYMQIYIGIFIHMDAHICILIKIYSFI